MIHKEFQPTIHRFDELNSTNTKLKELSAKGATEGTVVVAAKQTAGRGRGSHLWHSPVGGLYFSALLFPRSARHLPELSILAGLALAQGVKESLPKSVDVTLKWPNDCLVNWKKVGGVMSEAVGNPAGGACVVGIGVNINLSEKDLEPFQKNAFQATSFQITGGSAFDVEPVFQVVLKKLFTIYHLYQEQGFNPIRYLWERNCQFIGKRVELRELGWQDHSANPPAGEVGVTSGTMVGIDEQGALVLSNVRGERHSYINGEITCFWP